MRPPRWSDYVLGIIGALLLTVALVMTLMQPPAEDLMHLAQLFALTGSASALIGYMSFRLGWWRRLRRLSHTLTVGYTVAAGLTMLNVWLTARLMFINEHDLTLAGVLLIFASVISIAFGYFLSASLTQALQAIVHGVSAVSEGNFAIRLPVVGRDEIAQLTQAFNAMAARLEQMEADQRALEMARRDLVAWASHDLRTPLASLRAMLAALNDNVVTDPETVKRYLQQSQTEIKRLSALVDDLFELAQLDAQALVVRGETDSLSDLISDTLEGFTVRAQTQHITLTGEVAPEAHWAWMASDKISRVLHNLLENALRHTPPQGRVHVRAYAEATEIIITVSDTGSGIQPDDLPHIFERFYRGDTARGRHPIDRSGAGLGLAIAKGLVEAHRGRIGATSQPGQGTQITFTLPRYPPTPLA